MKFYFLLIIIILCSCRTPRSAPVFNQFSNVYEPSGFITLNNSILIVEDEEELAFSFATFSESKLENEGRIQTTFKLDDLEGLTQRNGVAYGLTSHSRNKKGIRKPQREQLFRVQISNFPNIVVDKIINDFRDQVEARFAELDKAMAELKVKQNGGFNIEELSWDPIANRYLVALRSPLLDGKAILIPLLNLESAFENEEKIQFGDLITVDLQGDGIRGMSYNPILKGFTMISGPSEKKIVPFKLWFIDENFSEKSLREITIPGLNGFEHAEGVQNIRIENQEKLLILSDDGDYEKKYGAKYLLLDYSDIRENNPL